LDGLELTCLLHPMTGAKVIAQSLVQLGVTHVFGIVGIPVIEVAEACIDAGIKFISFRNEQAATYAATAYGYLTGKPGVALVVGGPGVVHAMAGVENANANCLPLLLLAGSSETHQRGKGAFQELNQVALLTGYAKFAGQPATVRAIPYMIEKGYRTSYFGRPGATYVDLPADLIQGSNGDNSLQALTPPGAAPRSMGDVERVRRAATLIKSAKSPLLIIGKGAAYGRAEHSIRALHSQAGLPFLPTPMGKGVIPDEDPLNVSAARSAALKSADVILLLGGRLNWILHYGDSPKFLDGVKIIQVDISAEELGNNAGDPELGIVGDIDLVVKQLQTELVGWRSSGMANNVYETKLRNQIKAAKVENDESMPIKYQPVYRTIRETLARFSSSGRNIIYVSEGANTMDISRSSFPLSAPRTRLDAGTNATMGLGLGYAIAAKVASPDSLVVAIEGDSAFGFSAVEVETAVRSKLPMIIYVMNNSGVYHGVDESAYDHVDEKPLPSTALQLNTKYHILAESLGARGYLATTLEQVRDATEDAVRRNEVAVVNVIIDSGKDKKLEFGWMASTKPKL
jgi:2-hydroxyacyl-CoA lyase 1